MNNLYQIFNVTSDKQFSNIMENLELNPNEMIQLEDIANSYKQLNQQRQSILELMAGSADGNYEFCLNQFKQKNKIRKLKENVTMSPLTLNQVMELNDMIVNVAKKLTDSNCSTQIFNYIAKQLNKNVAQAFIGMANTSNVVDSELKFDTELTIDGLNVAQAIYPLKNVILRIADSFNTDKIDDKEPQENVQEEKEIVKESKNKILLEQSVEELKNLIDSTDESSFLNSIILIIDKQISNTNSLEEQNILANLKTIAQSKLNKNNSVNECIDEEIVTYVTGEDTFNDLLNTLKPTFISIVVNNEDGSIEDNDKQSVSNAINALSSHIDCNKSSKENNLEELETINTLLNQISTYFNNKLCENEMNEAKVVKNLKAKQQSIKSLKDEIYKRTKKQYDWAMKMTQCRFPFMPYFQQYFFANYDLPNYNSDKLKDKLYIEVLRDLHIIPKEGETWKEYNYNPVELIKSKRATNESYKDKPSFSLTIENSQGDYYELDGKQISGDSFEVELKDGDYDYITSGIFNMNGVVDGDVLLYLMDYNFDLDEIQEQISFKIKTALEDYGQLKETINSEKLFKNDDAIASLQNEIIRLKQKLKEPTSDKNYYNVKLSYAETKLKKLLAKNDEIMNEDTIYDHSWYEVEDGNYPKRTKEGVIIKEEEIDETCSAGATSAGAVATVTSSPKRKKRKLSIGESLFLDFVKQGKDCVSIFDGNHYKLNNGYLYKNAQLVKTKNLNEMLEFIQGNIDLPLLEGILPIQLDMLLEDENTTQTINRNEQEEITLNDLTPQQRQLKQQQEQQLDTKLQSSTDTKVAVEDPNNTNNIEQNQELVGVDDSDIQNKKYVVKNPQNNKVKVVDATQIKTLENQ